MSLRSNSLEAPLFDSEYSSSLTLFGSQRLRSGERITIFGTRGYPSANPYFTAELSEIEIGDASGRLIAGDTLTQTLLPDRIGSIGPLSSAVRLRGVSTIWSRGRDQAQLTIGRQRFRLNVEGIGVSDASVVTDASWLRKSGRESWGAGLTVIDEPSFVTDDESSSAAVLSANYFREVRPFSHVYGSVLSSEKGALAARAGMTYRAQTSTWNLTGFLYDEELPLLYPTLRPGDTGVQASGRYDLSYSSRVSAAVTWLDRSVISPGSTLQSNFALYYSFGEDRPALTVRWDHNDVIFEFLDDDRIETFGDRYTIEYRKRDRFNSYGVVLNHSDDTFGERSQLLATYDRLVSDRTRVDAYAVIQYDDRERLGLITETVFEREWRVNWSYRLGLGAAWIDQETERGEGIATIGLVRRNIRNGWYGVIDATIPFDIGLPRANRVRDRLRVGIGTTFRWEDLSDLRGLVAPILDRNAFGGVVGTVLTESGTPLANVTIVINGRPSARTNAQGAFEAGSIPVGPASVAVDPVTVDPSFVINQSRGFDVIVEPRQNTPVAFTVKEAVSLSGSIVRCDGDRIVPLGGLLIALIGPQGSFSLTTNSNGSFAIQGVTPGTYQMIINPSDQTAGLSIPSPELDLTGDLLAYVIRIGCE